MNKAQNEAQDIIKKAQDKAEKLSSQEEVLKLATAKANEIVGMAQQRSKEIKQNTGAYSETVLEALEEMMTRSLLEVKQTRQQVRGAIK